MFFLIDKPIGLSSFDVIRKLRKLLGIKKMGHAGTLDPLASGCLLIATGESTKLIPLFDSARKEYIFTVRLDGKSESLDTGTEVFPTSLETYREKSKRELRDFLLWQKTQIPPRYSALHVDGERAYDLARAWKEFTLEERRIQIDDVEIIYMSISIIEIRIVISSGGYVRAFAPIIGQFFEVEWWYIESLRRTKIITEYGILDIENTSNIENPVEISYSMIFPTIHTIEISEKNYIDLKNGKILNSNSLSISQTHKNDKVFLSYKEENFISLCEYTGNTYSIIRNNV